MVIEYIKGVLKVNMIGFRRPVSWIYAVFMQDLCINMRKVSVFTVAVYLICV